MLKCIIIFLIIFSCFYSVNAQNLTGSGEVLPTLKTNPESLKEWKALRFGMFVHWGPVSLRGTEIGWSRGKEIPFREYDALYKKFNPVSFNAAEWVSLLKQAGMKYLVFVSKHHDGFVMWDSETTDYDIMSTPFKKDVMKELSDECARQGILFGTYYSILDWKHPDYPLEQNRPGYKNGAEMIRYVEYMKRQIRELILKYHTKILWFDGEWEDPWTHSLGMYLYVYARSLDDEILINNRVDKGRQGMEGTSLSNKFAGDFATPEQQVGRYDDITPWESCITMCEQWAWKPEDNLKSFDECILTLVRTAGGDGNLLLNVGPMPDGEIEPRQAERLKEIGQWLALYGRSIYGTRGGPVIPQKWGVATQKDNKVYLHVLSPEKEITIRDFPRDVTGAISLYDSSNLAFTYKDKILSVFIPSIPEKTVDYVIELNCNP